MSDDKEQRTFNNRLFDMLMDAWASLLNTGLVSTSYSIGLENTGKFPDYIEAYTTAVNGLQAMLREAQKELKKFEGVDVVKLYKDLNEANSEIDQLNEKLAAMQNELDRRNIFIQGFEAGVKSAANALPGGAVVAMMNSLSTNKRV